MKQRCLTQGAEVARGCAEASASPLCLPVWTASVAACLCPAGDHTDPRRRCPPPLGHCSAGCHVGMCAAGVEVFGMPQGRKPVSARLSWDGTRCMASSSPLAVSHSAS